MNYLFDFLIVWLSVSLVILATAWYATVIIPPFFPQWWQRVVVDIEPTPRITRK